MFGVDLSMRKYPREPLSAASKSGGEGGGQKRIRSKGEGRTRGGVRNAPAKKPERWKYGQILTN